MSEKLYSKDGVCILPGENGTARLGVSCHLLEKAGKVLFINLCDEDEILIAGESFGDLEAHKGVFDLVSPVSGSVVRVNDELLGCPDALSNEAWLVEVEPAAPARGLLSREEYLCYIKNDNSIKEAR